MKRLIIAILCLGAASAILACEGYDDYVKNLKSEYGYVTVRFHELISMTIDDIIHWVEGDSVGEKTWK